MIRTKLLRPGTARRIRDDGCEHAHEADAARNRAVFLEQARHLASWHRQRAENTERKAAGLLGFAGVALTLVGAVVPTLLSPGRVIGSFEVAGALLLGLAALLLLGSGGCALGAMMMRSGQTPGIGDLRVRWTESRSGRDWSESRVLGSFAKQWIEGSGESSPLADLHHEAEKRARWVNWSVALLFSAAVLLTAAILMLIAGGVL